MLGKRSCTVDVVLSAVPLAVVGGFALIAGVIDAREFRVPNLLTVPMVVSGTVFHAVAGGWDGLKLSLAGLAFGFGIMILFYLMGIMGAGDVKFMAGVGAWWGMPATLYVFAVAAIATAVYSAVLLVRQGKLSRLLLGIRVLLFQCAAMSKHLVVGESVQEVVRRDDRRSRLVPFVAMAALGVVAVAVWTWLAG